MRKRIVFISITGLLISLALISCASTAAERQDAADYDNLQARADVLTMANQAYGQTITDKNAQIAAIQQQLTDTRTLVGNQSDLHRQLVDIIADRDNLRMRVDSSQAKLTDLQKSDAVEAQRVEAALDKLRLSLKTEIGNGSVTVHEYRGTVLIDLTSNVTFAADSGTLKPEFTQTLMKLAAIFKILPEKIVRIEGHTATFDNDAQKNSWELGATRAIQVTKFLQTQGGIDPARMVVVSFGKFWPDAPNDSEANRVLNRTVTFSLLDRNFYELNELRLISAK